MTLQGEVTRHRLTACNQEQRPSTPRTGTAHAETAIQNSPLGAQAQETRENGSSGRGGVEGQDKEYLNRESSLNAPASQYQQPEGLAESCAGETVLWAAEQVEELNALLVHILDVQMIHLNTVEFQEEQEEHRTTISFKPPWGVGVGITS